MMMYVIVTFVRNDNIYKKKGDIVMVFNFSVKFKFFDGFSYESDMFNHVSKFHRVSLFNRNCDAKGYYSIAFTRLRDCKDFINHMFFAYFRGFCLQSAYIVSYNASYCLYASISRPRRSSCYVIRYHKYKG